MARKHLYPMQTRVAFDIAQGLDTGTAIIIDNDVEIEDGKPQVHYKLQVETGSLCETHRDKKGDLWVNDFEVKPLPKR